MAVELCLVVEEGELVSEFFFPVFFGDHSTYNKKIFDIRQLIFRNPRALHT